MFDDEIRPMKNLSVSKIEKALLCPKNFELTYIHKIPQPMGWQLLAGNVVHEIIEHAIRTYASSGQYPDWQTMDDQFEPTWQRRQQAEEEKGWFIGWSEKEDDPLTKLKPEYRALVRVAREEVLPTIRPWMMEAEPVVEYRVDLELRSRVGMFSILGYADLLDASGVLMDWKSTGAEVSDRAKRTWLQFAAYSLWAWPLVGEENLRCEKIFLVRGNGNPRAERVPFIIGPKHREYFVNVAARIWEMIHYGIYYPNSETWLCKPGWCPFWAGCQGDVAKVKHEQIQAPAPGAP